jgi:hypothetical protein
MADDLAAFRRANIGEVIRAKDTMEATLGVKASSGDDPAESPG